MVPVVVPLRLFVHPPVECSLKVYPGLVCKAEYNKHNIGRLRMALTDAARPVGLELKGPPGDIAALAQAIRDRG